MKTKLMKTMVLVAVMSLSTVGSMVTSVTASSSSNDDLYTVNGSGFILNNGSDYVNTEYMC